MRRALGKSQEQVVVTLMQDGAGGQICSLWDERETDRERMHFQTIFSATALEVNYS